MAFRIRGLDPAPFRPLFGLPDTALHDQRIIRLHVDGPGYPDRIELRDARPGETVLLLNHLYQPADSPYRGSHAIFVREGAETAFDAVDTVPEALRRRLMSLRAFDEAGMILDADIADGPVIEPLVERLFLDRRVAYLHAHNAKYGCYAARIDRV